MNEVPEADPRCEKLSQAFEGLLRWCLEGRRSPSSVGIRLIALNWVFRTGGTDDSSLRDLAIQFGISKSWLTRHTAGFAQSTGRSNR